MRGRGRKLPFQLTLALSLVSLVILLFGRNKKPTPVPMENDQSVPRLPVPQANPFPVPDSLKKTVTETDMGRARDKLRVASLERDIIGDALTKIYEAEAKGQINESEKNQLIQRYKVDLKRVDGEIDVQKKIVDLHELESAKEDLLKSFYEKLMEIDLRIGQLKPGLDMLAINLGQEPKPAKPVAPTPVKEAQQQAPPTQQEKTVRERPKSKAEERLEAIKEEVLKAMERLEQIETET